MFGLSCSLLAALVVSGLGLRSLAVGNNVNRSAPPVARFDVVWNGPSQGCSPAIPLEDYGIRANPAQSFNGSVITLFYQLGLWPTLAAEMNQTACWAKDVPPCS